MKTPIMRKVSVTGTYAALAATDTVVSVTVSTPPTNVANVLFKAADGADVPWVPGEWHDFRSINLAALEIKGSVGDVVTIIGGTE